MFGHIYDAMKNDIVTFSGLIHISGSMDFEFKILGHSTPKTNFVSINFDFNFFINNVVSFDAYHRNFYLFCGDQKTLTKQFDNLGQ
jgi:hypothetical protein